MDLSIETRPSLEGGDRVLVTVSPPQLHSDPAQLLIRMASSYQDLMDSGVWPKPVVEEFAQVWRLPLAMAKRLLAGEVDAKVGPTGSITVFMNAEELLDCYLARVGLAEGAYPSVEDADHWQSPIDQDRRLRRIDQALQVHARYGGHGSRGPVGGEEQLTQLLLDLRVWCDLHKVDLLRCIGCAFQWAT